MRFLFVNLLFVGLIFGSPTEKVEVTKLAEPSGAIQNGAKPEFVTQRARQDEEDEGSNEDVGTTLPPTNKLLPDILQTNATDFLTEFQYLSQYELKEKEPGVVPSNATVPVAPSTDVQNGTVASTTGASTLTVSSTPGAPTVTSTVSTSTIQPVIAATTEDEDDDDSDEVTTAPEDTSLKRTQVQSVDEPVDNEITNDDVTTIKSFSQDFQKDDEPKLTFLTGSNSSFTNLDSETGILSDGDGRAACECGKLPFRIPIGEEANINARPWTVAVVRGGLIAGGRPHCSGALINDRYVLTSATCMEGLHPNGVQVWLTALSTLQDHNLDIGTTKVNVQDVIMHPNYHRANKENDICLVKLSHPVDITTSNYYSPVCLPSGTRNDYSGRYGVIFGWGNGRVNRLCTATVPILDNAVCKRDSRHSASITGNMMCAGYLTPTTPIRTDDCVGDAGGPLTTLINGRTSLIGITSWGYEYHNRGHTPTVYTRVSGYAEWILHNTEDADWCVS